MFSIPESFRGSSRARALRACAGIFSVLVPVSVVPGGLGGGTPPFGEGFGERPGSPRIFISIYSLFLDLFAPILGGLVGGLHSFLLVVTVLTDTFLGSVWGFGGFPHA